MELKRFDHFHRVYSEFTQCIIAKWPQDDSSPHELSSSPFAFIRMFLLTNWNQLFRTNSLMHLCLSHVCNCTDVNEARPMKCQRFSTLLWISAVLQAVSQLSPHPMIQCYSTICHDHYLKKCWHIMCNWYKKPQKNLILGRGNEDCSSTVSELVALYPECCIW